LPSGGIKLANIPLERHGRLMADVINDQALENMLVKAKGYMELSSA